MKVSTIKRLFDTIIVLKKIVIFVIIVTIGFVLYRLIIDYTIASNNYAKGLATFWFFTAYLVLPRVHRLLTKVYLPDYYIGRARTGEGILGDPINLSVTGSSKDLELAMKKAGWIRAEDLNASSTFKMIKNSVLRRSYPNAPVSSLFVFGEKQNYAYQKEVGGSTSKRHHVRFWKTPKGWYLPGGFSSDWVGAATYDKRVGFSLFTFQITHKIEEDTDIERDYVVDTIKKSNRQSKVHIVENFSTGYHCKNGGGDSIKTDGNLPFITL